MKENLIFCVLILVTYQCDGYGPRPTGVLEGILTGAQEVNIVQGVLEEISKGGLNIQGQFQANSQQGNYYKPQVANNYGGYKPQKPVETIIVVVEEESPEQNQYGQQGQYGSGYGYIPQNFNKPDYQNKPGYNYGGNYNNGLWNVGHGHNRPHHRPGHGHNPHYHGNHYGNNVPNFPPNNNNFNQNPFENNPHKPSNRPFDKPFNNDNGNGNQNENLPTGDNRPNRPFDRPVNTNFGNIPTDPPHRPFDRPFNENLPGIPTSLPGQGDQEKQNKPNTEQHEQKPVVTTTTESSMHTVEKTTKDPKGDDVPLFVPLNPNQYVYGGDKIEINAPKREANDNPKPAEADYSDSNIDPLDIRIGENP